MPLIAFSQKAEIALCAKRFFVKRETMKTWQFLNFERKCELTD